MNTHILTTTHTGLENEWRLLWKQEKKPQKMLLWCISLHMKHVKLLWVYSILDSRVLIKVLKCEYFSWHDTFHVSAVNYAETCHSCQYCWYISVMPAATDQDCYSQNQILGTGCPRNKNSLFFTYIWNYLQRILKFTCFKDKILGWMQEFI